LALLTVQGLLRVYRETFKEEPLPVWFPNEKEIEEATQHAMERAA
jgi:hypothetical protein